MPEIELPARLATDILGTFASRSLEAFWVIAVRAGDLRGCVQALSLLFGWLYSLPEFIVPPLPLELSVAEVILWVYKNSR